MKTEQQIQYRIKMLKSDLKNYEDNYGESDEINCDYINIRITKALIMELEQVLHPTVFLEK